MLTLPGHFTASTQVCGVQVTDTPGQSLKGWQDPEGRGCEESNAEAGVPLGTGLGSGTPWLWDVTQIPSPFPASVPAEWRATAERTRSRRLQFLNLQLWDPGPPLPTNRTLRLELGSSLTGTGQGCWGQAAWESWALPSHQAGPPTGRHCQPHPGDPPAYQPPREAPGRHLWHQSREHRNAWSCDPWPLKPGSGSPSRLFRVTAENTQKVVGRELQSSKQMSSPRRSGMNNTGVMLSLVLYVNALLPASTGSHLFREENEAIIRIPWSTIWLHDGTQPRQRSSQASVYNSKAK